MSVDLNSLKENIQTIFEVANTTTAATYLSNGLSNKVKKVFKLNPSRIPIQASHYPCITIFVDHKDIELADIARNQSTAKRKAEIEIKIAGAVWNNKITNLYQDDADNDCEDLMENIEEILRENPTLSDSVTWSYPTSVTYHNSRIDEDAHMRAGILSLNATVYY